MSSLKLYSYFRSSCSYRVRIALALKGIEYEYEGVHLVEGKQKTEEFGALNPLHQVPALVIDGKCITQSMAIVEYLDEKFPKNRLFPEDILLKAKVREICEMINSGIQPIQNLSVLLKHSEDAAARSEWGHYWIHKGFVALETFLGKTAGKYCVGNDITTADCFLIPQIANANRFKVDMSEFPIISKIEGELKTHEAFVAAHPNNQPDCPEKAG